MKPLILAVIVTVIILAFFPGVLAAWVNFWLTAAVIVCIALALEIVIVLYNKVTD